MEQFKVLSQGFDTLWQDESPEKLFLIFTSVMQLDTSTVERRDSHLNKY